MEHRQTFKGADWGSLDIWQGRVFQVYSTGKKSQFKMDKWIHGQMEMWNDPKQV